jgi:3-oxoacyl-[acyl-carrier protein] reductase
MFDLSGKVAIVTGGSRGIGRGTAEALAAQGAHVVINYVNNAGAASETVEAIRAAGGKAEAVQFDVADGSAAMLAISEVVKRLRGLDILVASAGVCVDALLLQLKDEDFDKLFAINVRGAVACARAAVEHMIRRYSGRIIFMSSVIGERGNVGQTAYAATKSALLGVTKTLAREYASRNITVNAVTPGYVETDMTRALPEEAKQPMLAQVALRRPATIAEIAAAVVFLASDEAGYITGHALRVNGGMYM